MWRVIGESTARGRFHSRVVDGLTPLVGRTEEIALLHRRWDLAKDGDGQIILLPAPAGFGKSRMMQEFREDLGDFSITCLQYFGSPFHVNSAFYPFIRQLEWAAGIVRTDTGPRKLDNARTHLVAADRPLLTAASLAVGISLRRGREKEGPLTVPTTASCRLGRSRSNQQDSRAQ